MATLNQYQRYSQKENATTNNVLLMLSNLYEQSPELYEEYIMDSWMRVYSAPFLHLNNK